MRTMAWFQPTAGCWERRERAWSRLACGHPRRGREAALTRRARRYPAGRGNEATRCPLRIIALAADHQLPGDARHLVGQRHGGELWRLAFEQFEPPGRGMPAPLAALLDPPGCSRHQPAAQGLVPGPGDHAEPHLAGGRVILRVE